MRYRAFFSYSRADNRVANWLHGQLDRYRTPKALIGIDGKFGNVPSKLHPIFRDRTDLPSGGHLSKVLQDALEDSETLIVLCSPAAAKSAYVNHEVETFIRLGRQDRIFPVIADGEPNSRDPEAECFPPALRPLGILAADLRHIKGKSGQVTGDGKNTARLKLTAGLLGLPLDELVKREQRRQRQLTGLATSAAGLFMAVSIAAGYFYFDANDAKGVVAQQLGEITKKAIDLQIGAIKLAVALKHEAEARERADRSAHEAELHLAEAADFRSGVFQSNSEQLFKDGYFSDSLLMALHGDPQASREGSVHLLRPEGLKLSRDAVIRAFTAEFEIRRLNGHQSRISAVAISPDGHRALTASDDGTVRIWDLHTGNLVSTFIQPLYGQPKANYRPMISSAAFSPDGKRILVTSWDGALTIWDAQKEVLLTTSLTGEPTPLKGAFSPDGRKILVGGVSGFVGIFESNTLKLLAKFKSQGSQITDVSFSSGGDKIATSALDCAVRVSDAAASNSVKILGDPNCFTAVGLLETVAFKPGDDWTVAAGSKDGTIYEWNVEAGSISLEFHTYGCTISTIAYSSDGRRILTGCAEGWARLWDLQSRRLIKSFQRHSMPITSVALSPDGSIALTGSEDKTARLWDATVKSTHRKFHLSGGVRSVVFAPGKDQIMFGTANGLKIWNMDTSQFIKNIDFQQNPIEGMAVSNDGRRIATTGRSDNAVRVTDLVTGKVLTTLRHPVDNGEVQSLVFSPDGRSILTGTRKNVVRLWDSKTGDIIRTFVNHASLFDHRALDFSPDGRFILTCADNTAFVWNALTGKLTQTLRGHDQIITSGAFSPDGSRVLTGSGDKSVRLWNSRSGDFIASFIDSERARSSSSSLGGRISSVTFSPDGRFILTGSFEGAQLWDSFNRILLWSFTDDDLGASSAIFSPDGTQILTLNLERDASLWKTPKIIFETAKYQTRISCDRLEQVGLTAFSDAYRQKYAILANEPRDPCKAWGH